MFAYNKKHQINVLFVVISPLLKYLRFIRLPHFVIYFSFIHFLLHMYNWLILLPIIACFDNIIFTFHFVIF